MEDSYPHKNYTSTYSEYLMIHYHTVKKSHMDSSINDKGDPEQTCTSSSVLTSFIFFIDLTVSRLFFLIHIFKKSVIFILYSKYLFYHLNYSYNICNCIQY